MPRISESQELPITQGKLEVDTSQGSVMIHLIPGHPNDHLTIAKVSNDSHTVVLYDGNDIIIFGVPSNAKLGIGHGRSVQLVSDGTNWVLMS